MDKAPIYFIVNTLTSRSNHSEIGHWLAVSLNYVSSKNMVNLKFFDSFAKNVGYYRPHISKAVKYIRLKYRKLNIRLAFDSLTKPIQAIVSKLCGIYAALFVIKSVLQKKCVKYLPCLNLTFLGKNLWTIGRRWAKLWNIIPTVITKKSTKIWKNLLKI